MEKNPNPQATGSHGDRSGIEFLRHLDGLERDLLRGHAAIIARRRSQTVPPATPLPVPPLTQPASL